MAPRMSWRVAALAALWLAGVRASDLGFGYLSVSSGMVQPALGCVEGGKCFLLSVPDASAGAPQLQKSTDGGANWAARSALVGGSWSASVPMLSCAGPQVCLALWRDGLTNLLWTSSTTNGGASWGGAVALPMAYAGVQVTDTPNLSCYLPNAASSLSSATCVVSYAQNSDVITVRSTTSGVTWDSPVVAQSAIVSSRPSVSCVSNSMCVLAFSDKPSSGSSFAYTMRSTNGGASWGSLVKLAASSDGETSTSYVYVRCISLSSCLLTAVLDSAATVSWVGYSSSATGAASWGSMSKLAKSTNSAVSFVQPQLSCAGATCVSVWTVSENAPIQTPRIAVTNDLGTTWSAFFPDLTGSGLIGNPDVVCQPTQGFCTLAFNYATSTLEIVVGIISGTSVR
jgi:hypothetical protein